MQNSKIREFSDAIDSGILIMPDPEDGKLIVVAKGSGMELEFYLATLIADMSNIANVPLGSIVSNVFKHALTIKDTLKIRECT